MFAFLTSKSYNATFNELSALYFPVNACRYEILSTIPFSYCALIKSYALFAAFNPAFADSIFNLPISKALFASFKSTLALFFSYSYCDFKAKYCLYAASYDLFVAPKSKMFQDKLIVERFLS
mgnify:CR=1 FL=1